MATLQDILVNAQHGQAMAEFGRAYGLTQGQTENAVAALLPAISIGLKRSTATPEGLGDLFSLAGLQPDLYAMYEDPAAAFSAEGEAAGNAVLANMFGSPDVSRAVAAQAQQLSGVTGTILKKLLPVLAGMLLSGLMRGGSGQAAPAPQNAPQQPAPPSGGGLFDILRQIFQQGTSGAGSSGPTGSNQSPVPPLGEILDSIGDGRRAPTEPQPPLVPVNIPRGQPVPNPDAGGQPMPGGDVFGQILTELGKAIQDGRVKPVIVGPYKIDLPGQVNVPGQTQAPGSGQAQAPGGGAGDIFGQILREVLGGALNQGQAPRAGALMDSRGGAGSVVFGDGLESGQDVARDQAESLREIFDRFGLTPPR